MSDLISRSALLKELMHCDASGRRFFEAVMEIIKEQPTAYDVDKVVEQLEGLGKQYNEDWEKATSTLALGAMCGIEKAIEIVKAGRVDE